MEKFKGYDISLVIINAGLMNNGKFNEVSIKAAQDMLDVNLYQYGMLASLFGEILAKRKQKSGLILVSSGVAWRYTTGTTLYSATKAFVLFLVEGFSLESNLEL